MAVFVITHSPRAPLPRRATTYTFVTDGLDAALDQAKAAAGDKDVGIWRGASIARQYLRAGLLDEFQIHLIPVLIGDGVRLFEGLDSERSSSSEPGPSRPRARRTFGSPS
jgi:dihydrofolate reductase